MQSKLIKLSLSNVNENINTSSILKISKFAKFHFLNNFHTVFQSRKGSKQIDTVFPDGSSCRGLADPQVANGYKIV